MCKYCLECKWQLTAADDCTEAEASKKAIEHFVETGHTVESFRLPPPVTVSDSET
ncbi:hypothetical protein [Natronorubrum aibiense]|uniref:hypothetical protein n=1 Tax=Natronorubrum aibiense TaxID=348826 RepID=UPI0014575BBD|nr:hypothetical protein [Natronorubrum aibiense]